MYAQQDFRVIQETMNDRMLLRVWKLPLKAMTLAVL